MSLPAEQAQNVLPILRGALSFNADSVVNLVRRHWLSYKDRDALTWQALGMGDVAPQVGEWLDSLVLVVERSPIGEWAVAHLAGVISAALPDEAPRLVAAWFKHQIHSANRIGTTDTAEEEKTQTSKARRIKSILEAQHFYDLEAIAEASPKAFIEALWPPFIDALTQCTSEHSEVMISYQETRGLLFDNLDEEGTNYERPLLRSIQLGIHGWAKIDPASFLDFVAANAKSEILIVHRLLVTGLTHTVEHSPHFVLEYLMNDPRRLVLGPFTDIHRESVALIKAVCPLLSAEDYSRLETNLLDWRYFNDTIPQEDASVRLQRLQWARSHRLRLLRALPKSRLSSQMQKIVSEEERAFPNLNDNDMYFSGVQWIGSPVKVEQMNLAADVDILNLFKELTDDAGWNHPRHQMKGGAIQAGRELAELTKKDLTKTLRIIRALDPLKNEIPVSLVLRELVPAGLTAEAFYSLLEEFEDKGFVGNDFRREAAFAVSEVANPEKPVPDTLINRMEGWLISMSTESSHEINTDAETDSHSILWRGGSITTLPNGNYPTLRALTRACMKSEPARLELWLAILHRHLTRIESPKVWNAMLPVELLNLSKTELSHAEAFIDELVENQPCIIKEKGWPHFIAHAFRWASHTAVHRWMMSIVEGDKEGLKVAGELIGLRHALHPAEPWSRELAEKFANNTSTLMAIGLAHSVANLWHEPIFRPVVHPVLLKLLRSRNDHVLEALSTIFLNDGFFADTETREILDALIAHPSLLKNGRAERLPEMLANLVNFDSERVCKVVNILLNLASDQMGNISTSWYLSTEWLLDIALQLQDMGKLERAAGSELFERMLEFNMPQAREMTLDLDKRTPVGSSPRASRRRRSRARKSASTIKS